MFRKMTYLIAVVLLLALIHPASALISWDDGAPDSLWSTPENWSTNTVPTGTDPASIDGPEDTHCVVAEGFDAVCETLRVGNGGVLTNLDITGGSLTASGAYVGVDSPSGHGVLNVSGGRFATGSLQLGWDGIGTLNMTGGLIELADELVIPGLSGTGTANLRGGIVHAADLRMTSAKGHIEMGAGALILQGDDTERLQGYIDAGWITAYRGQGTLHLDYDPAADRTTLAATAWLDPTPPDAGLVTPGAVELSWTLPDPCVPGTPVLVDVYFTDNLTLLEEFSDPEAIRIVSAEEVSSVTVQTQAKTRYYWAVDTYVGSDNDPVLGPIFTFLSDNLVPVVDAGPDVVTWLVDGLRTGTLDATVTDDGALMPYSVSWSVIEQPAEGDAVIAQTSAEDTTVTLTGLGRYTLQLAAFDGEYIGTDTLTIGVYESPCQAAQSLPDYEPLVGDLNNDCVVDELDMALLEANWMEDSALTEEWYLVE